MPETPDFERIPVYEPATRVEDPYQRFLEWSGNTGFRRSLGTWISLFLLLIVYPASNLVAGVEPEDLSLLRDDTLLLLTLVGTIVIQWLMFLVLFVASFRERTLLRGLGLSRLRAIDIAWAISFLLAANVILIALTWILGQVGLPMPGEIRFLIPEDAFGRVIWVVVSITAGFCEEIAFRGYLMTRLRILGRTKTWVIPVVVSSVVFGLLHAYQSVAGMIVLTVYGFMFALLYIRTRSLWPCVIAHFLQDFTAMFIPQ